MARKRRQTNEEVTNGRIRTGKNKRLNELKCQAQSLSLKLAVLETMYELEKIRRNNLIEKVIKLNSITEVQNLVKNLELKKHLH